MARREGRLFLWGAEFLHSETHRRRPPLQVAQFDGPGWLCRHGESLLPALVSHQAENKRQAQQGEAC